MAQLIAGSCPSDTHLDPLARFAAAKDRLDVMLFVVMSAASGHADAPPSSVINSRRFN